MTHSPGVIDEMCTAQEALARIAQQGFHQLMVTRDGRLVGVVSERDLFALQRVTMRNILQSIRLARDVGALKRVVPDIESLTDNLVAQGAAAEPLTHTITSLNDALTHRLFDLLLPDYELDEFDWCWLSVGSEGRREQTVVTDQDNAILFHCPTSNVTARAASCSISRVRPTRRWRSSGSRCVLATSWLAIRSTASRPPSGESASPAGSANRRPWRCSVPISSLISGRSPATSGSRRTCAHGCVTSRPAAACSCACWWPTRCRPSRRSAGSASSAWTTASTPARST